MESSWQPPEKQGERPGFPLRALLISLALHGMALGMLAPQWVPQARETALAPRMEGRLVASRPHDIVPEPPKLASRHVLSPKPEHRPEMSSPLSGSAHPTSTSMISTLAAPRAMGSEAIPRVMAELPTVALAPALVERGADAAGLRQFRLALAGEARHLRRYPEMAQRAGLAGTTEVRVAVEAGGAIRRTDLSRSSGHALLDAAALEMLGEALARTPLPESLRGRSFAVLMPVVFEVED